MARTISAALQTLLSSGVMTVCLCWLIKRKDGTKLGFTEHDADIRFGGQTYQHSSSFTGSTLENQLGLAVSNMDVLGALASDAITEDDLECGRYDAATVTLYLVDWTTPTSNAVLISGTLGQITIGDLAYQAELRSLCQNFQQYIGSLSTPKCRSDLFDTGSGLEGGCRLTKPAAISATVTAVTDRAHFQVSAVGTFTAGTKGSLSGGYFAEGTATGTAGKNLNVVADISDNDDSLNVTLKIPLPDDVAIGDTFDLQIGCDKTAAVCETNYNNLDNFRGEPFVPGTDSYFHVNN